jgi:hypothetical protein
MLGVPDTISLRKELLKMYISANREISMTPPIKEVIIVLTLKEAKLLKDLIGGIGGGIDTQIQLYFPKTKSNGLEIREVTNKMYIQLNSLGV